MTDPAPPRPRTVALIVATALFMQNMDSTVLATALPSIAVDLGANPLHLKLALTSYLLALAVFIPASGWVAERYGARAVFRAAIFVFAAGSAACSLALDLPTLVAARILQGIGGAMMVPVGRLVVLRATPKEGLLSVMAWLTLPALLGPIVGPPFGGFLTDAFGWRTIFLINLPVAALGFVFAGSRIPDIRGEAAGRFDTLGFGLIGPGLALLLGGATVAGLGLVPWWVSLAASGAGVVLLIAFGRHALATENPIIDLRVLAIPSFGTAMAGGFLFRVGAGATPFLIPLLYQLAFGWSALESGLVSLATGLGAILMKPLAEPLIGRFGFRRILVANALIAAVLVASPALFSAAWAPLAMMAVLFVGGLTRSLQFTAINAVAYADVPKERFARASTIAAVNQELCGSIGVSIAALGLEIAHATMGGAIGAAAHFPPVFLLSALIAATAAIAFALMPKGTGSAMVARGRGDQS